MSQKIWVLGDAVVDLIPDGRFVRCADFVRHSRSAVGVSYSCCERNGCRSAAQSGKKRDCGIGLRYERKNSQIRKEIQEKC